jgi:DNA repair protein RadA/Sms
MAKTKTVYACTECGGQALKWQGQCPHCQAWNTLEETVAEAAPSANRFGLIADAGKLQRLSEVEAREEERISTCIPEFDRVLGGGLVAGGVVLIGGDPGIGKSTLLLQALADMGATNKVLYVTGEESPQRWRCARAGSGQTPAACTCLPRSTWKKSRPRSTPRSRTSR